MLARVVPRSIVLARGARTYTSSAREGSVATSKEFGKKEKAHEDQYARKHEREQLEKLKKEIDRKKAELADLQKQHDDVSKSA
ncbi:hypothetical protein HETIRDRAFT_410465 [Heterobasidion irregulare TC 32-1]|uniref:ATPase inhibitor, mitochondrial n=1 Tax=Heterobasidion irregulare (strain TC 32-1) TaxID=747525 RepID=W4K1X6_HETIT|nr:uncharacterized protein HETIRDRAFT_410465 [Heterobasidion irregulare TC 32-1]ETW79808.1 hypothetical protein HETIRDRAFT_410465 [Heterobasidion irregulare TC 32-1]